MKPLITLVFLIVSILSFGQETEKMELPDKNAQFAGGMEAMFAFIQENIQYPPTALEKGIQGKVYLDFIVNANGSISDINVIRGVTKELDSVAVECIAKMPLWIPGEAHGKRVRTKCRIPIVFTLDDGFQTKYGVKTELAYSLKKDWLSKKKLQTFSILESTKLKCGRNLIEVKVEGIDPNMLIPYAAGFTISSGPETNQYYLDVSCPTDTFYISFSEKKKGIRKSKFLGRIDLLPLLVE